MNLKTVFVSILLIPVVSFASAFPSISGKTLLNQAIKVPNQASLQLLILGFDMTSADPMEAWVRGLNLVPSSNISWVQIPVIGPVPPFVDGFIKRGMKKSMSKDIQRAFFPYFGNKKDDILKSIQGSKTLADSSTPFIVLISADGTIEFAKQIQASTENIQFIESKISKISVR